MSTGNIPRCCIHIVRIKIYDFDETHEENERIKAVAFFAASPFIPICVLWCNDMEMDACPVMSPPFAALVIDKQRPKVPSCDWPRDNLYLRCWLTDLVPSPPWSSPSALGKDQPEAREAATHLAKRGSGRLPVFLSLPSATHIPLSAALRLHAPNSVQFIDSLSFFPITVHVRAGSEERCCYATTTLSTNPPPRPALLTEFVQDHDC